MNSVFSYMVGGIAFTIIGSVLLSIVAGIVMACQAWASRSHWNALVKLLCWPVWALAFGAWWLVGTAAALVLAIANGVAALVVVAWLPTQGIDRSVISLVLLLGTFLYLVALYWMIRKLQPWQAFRRPARTPVAVPQAERLITAKAFEQERREQELRRSYM